MADSQGTDENLADAVHPVPSNIIPEHIKVSIYAYVTMLLSVCE